MEPGSAKNPALSLLEHTQGYPNINPLQNRAQKLKLPALADRALKQKLKFKLYFGKLTVVIPECLTSTRSPT